MSGGPLQWFPGRGLVPVESAAPVLTLIETPSHDEDDSEDEWPAVVESPRRKPAQRKAATPSPANIISLAKRRLRDVERELARLRKLEVERDELRRLIAAARPRKG